MKDKWFEVRGEAGGAIEVLIYDEIHSSGCEWHGGVCAGTLIESLAPYRDQAITLRINSPGGDVFAGLALYHYLSGLKDLTTVVDGIAASAASLVALAGRRLLMPANAFLMLHDPTMLVIGGSTDLRQAADTLDKHRENMAAVYAKETGATIEEARGWMAAETWFTGEQALKAGFADELTGGNAVTAHFDFARFRRAPDALKGGDRSARNPTTENMRQLPKPMDAFIKALTDRKILACGCGGANTSKPSEAEVAEKVISVVEQVTSERDDAKEQITKLEGELVALRKEQHTALEARAKATVETAIIEGRLQPELKDVMLAQYVADEAKTLETLAKLKPGPGVEPLRFKSTATTATSGAGNGMSPNIADAIKAEPDPAKRVAMRNANWHRLAANTR